MYQPVKERVSSSFTGFVGRVERISPYIALISDEVVPSSNAPPFASKVTVISSEDSTSVTESVVLFVVTLLLIFKQWLELLKIIFYKFCISNVKM